MKSLLEDALAQAGTATPADAGLEDATADSELQEMVEHLRTKIKIFGMGGGGSNTVNRISQAGITGADVYAVNTDAQHLHAIRSPHKILIGRRLTKGLGAGALPQVGYEAAQEQEDDLKKAMEGADMVFLTCGLGGGTGTGSASFIGQIARDMGALTLAFVTLPFKGEGRLRMANAEWGLERLRKVTDTVITIPNDKLLQLVPKLSLESAFKVSDEVLMRSIKGIAEVITKPGLVNIDYADMKTIMKDGGMAMIGMGSSEAIGEERVTNAMNEAINSPMLDVELSGATGLLVHVTGGQDMTVSEAERAVELVQKKASPSARIIWGAQVDPTMKNSLHVLVVATGVHLRAPTLPSSTPTPKRTL